MDLSWLSRFLLLPNIAPRTASRPCACHHIPLVLLSITDSPFSISSLAVCSDREAFSPGSLHCSNAAYFPGIHGRSNCPMIWTKIPMDKKVLQSRLEQLPRRWAIRTRAHGASHPEGSACSRSLLRCDCAILLVTLNSEGRECEWTRRFDERPCCLALTWSWTPVSLSTLVSTNWCFKAVWICSRLFIRSVAVMQTSRRSACGIAVCRCT